MSDPHTHDGINDPSFRPLMRSLLIEAAIYIPLVVIYFLVLRNLARDPLFRLYREMPTLYAIAGTALIFFQGILLEALTSWLLRQIGLRT